MAVEKLRRQSQSQWIIEPSGKMRVPVVIFADERLIAGIDEKVCEQAANVAALPGIVTASCVMPDAHQGYGFPIGGVAAFDADRGGVISAGGVGFDISCGVRSLRTGLTVDDIEPVREKLAEALARGIPAGLGRSGELTLSTSRIDEVLEGGARWAVDCGYGTPADLERIEEKGCMAQARPQYVSPQAKKRQSDEVGTLGSGNHYLEVQKVTEVCDANIAQIYGIKEGDVVISIHCGSRGLGHQIATDFLPQMVKQAASSGIELPDRELACAPISSRVGQEYLAAMRCGVNCALANRQVLTHLCRRIFDQVLPKASLTLLYDVSHNTCKVEEHCVDGKLRTLHVHRKGATRAFGPNHPSLPPDLRKAGQPVLIGGTMGTASYILAGTETGMSLAFGSCCHGAGRAMSRRQAKTQWQGKELVKSLAHKGIIIRGASYRGIAEEAPGAYKDVTWVVDATEKAGLAKKVAKLEPVICVKG